MWHDGTEPADTDPFDLSEGIPSSEYLKNHMEMPDWVGKTHVYGYVDNKIYNYVPLRIECTYWSRTCV